MDVLFVNIGKLVQVENEPKKWVAGGDMAKLPCLENAYLLVVDGLIKDFGPMSQLPDFSQKDSLVEVDVEGRLILPSFCDSHTHLVYAGSREMEYVDKIKGLSYEEIAKRGGGILNSAKRLHLATEEELYQSALNRIHEIAGFGTGAVEIKSGYGLTTANEIKMLRVIKQLKETTPLEIKATFLGAHAVPLEFKGRQSEYVNLIVNEMIPQVATEKLADYVDVFCDKGFFTVPETEKILAAAAKYDIRGKIHANELAFSGGIQVGVAHGALSVDHLEFVGDEEIKCLLGSETMPTILPGAAFFLNMPYSPARKMMQAGLPVALASDFNPGSSPSGNMKFIMSLGCINYRMTPEEVINAATINSAYAMGIQKTHGSICRGKVANLYITTRIPGYEFLPYAYTSNLIERVMLNGEFVS
ncbi:MAG TPA: imidazolonepropionase [Marinilabiliales bacterium]|nr:MAG: imidazolonepropionase [Bacteroidetes bacterium GWA2_40_14]OFX58705.1 MAG: imidazolonepropionase [Bacteroidetes bacterium GWC2_40_13]OFX71842.1 MAG: imidazolonepropionase [Bacteroidetes bacterium GWD2_40_43]OFX94640.1 MAG: imidazolonepropionase [Bacteroidetes bacterium GWE2_40_63]OFY17941.1 MAG: imidazolonepropionase [Bacteroidetes bacterium GWF2_40_13]OFZ24406.1 MAG: imidazolonepropionase [Bacteroidetes bacterium RIFOXYC2_FULL_40_12]HAM98406.1 imidazolonepropionase [Marinilabiliales b